MLDDHLRRARWIEAREQIERWLVDRGFPNPESGKRFRFETESGVNGQGSIEDYAQMMHGTGTREHFAARALDLIDRILQEADQAPWRAIGWAHELGVLDGDTRLAGVEPVWTIGQKSQEGAREGGKARSAAKRDRELAEEFLSRRERTRPNKSDTAIKREIGRSNNMKGDTARKAIDRGLKALGKI